jgi:hypothetical protein
MNKKFVHLLVSYYKLVITNAWNVQCEIKNMYVTIGFR